MFRIFTGFTDIRNMKKQFLPLLALLFFSANALAKYTKVKTLTHQAYYIKYLVPYLVEVDKTNGKLNIYNVDKDMTAALSFSPWMPSGYTLDTVFAINALESSDPYYIYRAKKGSNKQLLICDEKGKLSEQFVDGEDIRLINIGGGEKVIIRKLSGGTWSSEVYDVNKGNLYLENTYPTEWLGAYWWDLNNFFDQDYFHYFYIDKGNNQIREFSASHKSIRDIKYSVPSGYTARAFTESFFSDWFVDDYRTEFVVYFEKNGSYIAKMVSAAGEIQTFQNSQKLDRYREYLGNSKYNYILTSNVSTSSKTSWEFYSIDNSKSTNVATKQKTVNGQPFTKTWTQAESWGFAFFDDTAKKMRFLKSDFSDIPSKDLSYNVSSSDDIKARWIYYDGTADGDGSTQELFYLYQKSTGKYEFKISSGTTDLLTVQNARWFRTAPAFIYPGKSQVAVWIPGLGTELYEYDFSIKGIERIAPKDAAIDQPYPSITFNWKGAKKAKRYKIVIVEDTTGSIALINEIITDTFYTWSGANSNKTYYWRAQGINDGTAGVSPRKQWWEFKTKDERAKTPILLSPVDGTTVSGTTVELVWNASVNAIDYEYEYSTSNLFSTASSGIISDTKETISGLDHDETYYWRVRAINQINKSDWSTVWSFTTKKPSLVTAPTLISPSDKSTNQPTSPTLTCSNITGAIKYTFEWDESASFTNVQTATETQSNTTAVGLKGLTTYYWRAKVETAVGESDWSDAWSFTTADLAKIDAPDLVSPTNSATDLSINPNLVCSGVANAVKYTFEWDTNNQFTSSSSASENIAVTAVTGLGMSTTYYWRVKVQTANGISDWSDVWSFTTADQSVLDVPTLLLPANNSTGVDPANATFEWTKVSGATSYEVQVATDVNFDTYTTGSPTDESLTLTALAEGTTYYWRVRADDGSLRSEWSKIFTMTTGKVGSVGDVAFPSLSIYPNPVNNALLIELDEDKTNTRYQVQIFDVRGKMLLERRFNSLHQQKLTVAHLEAGVYLVKVSTAEKSQIIRFVKE